MEKLWKALFSVVLNVPVNGFNKIRKSIKSICEEKILCNRGFFFPFIETQLKKLQKCEWPIYFQCSVFYSPKMYIVKFWHTLNMGGKLEIKKIYLTHRFRSQSILFISLFLSHTKLNFSRNTYVFITLFNFWFDELCFGGIVICVNLLLSSA